LIFNKIQYTIFFLITMDFKRVLSTKTNVKQQNECHRLFKVDSILQKLAVTRGHKTLGAKCLFEF